MRILTPADESELSGILRGAGAQSFAIQGGGTRRQQRPAAAISTSAMTGISLYEPGALTIVLAAGTPVAEVEEVLRAEGQMLPFEPMDHRKLLGTSGTPTIGGMVAANVSGPRRIQAGACRDSMIGVRFVDGAGHIIKNGGRVMKNVTGYDLVKLMAGSCGTLGVVTEVAFKVLPRPEAVGVCLIAGLEEADAVRAMAAALTSPYDVTGAAHLPVGVDGEPVTMIRVEGFGESVDYRTGQLRAVLSGFGEVTVEMDPERTAAGWAYVRDVAGFADRPGDVWRISVKPGDGPVLAQALRAIAAVDVSYDWGGGLLWVLAPEGVDLRPGLAGFHGHAERVRGGDAPLREVFPKATAIAGISDGLRAKFDPNHVFHSA